MNNRYIFLSALAVLLNVLCVNAQKINDFEVTDLTMEVRDGYINLDMEIYLSDVSI